jgi:23S rRNA (adenine2030-N6)-methyltransferase
MLSYQHGYHAGNPADVHKHGLLAFMLAYMTGKDKPLTYIETHAGRGLYDLDDATARKTGEAQQGIVRLSHFFDAGHPYAKVLHGTRARHGANAYPGSPQIAATILRPGDRLHLAELHPQEFEALDFAMSASGTRCYRQDGFELAQSMCPPTPRRGLILIDPSYEIKTDYSDIPRRIALLHRAWNVGVICLWYPILKSRSHLAMLDALQKAHPTALRHEVAFPPPRSGHGMTGSGLFVINPPFGTDVEAARLSRCFASIQRRDGKT